jgi:hypothetical protein
VACQESRRLTGYRRHVCLGQLTQRRNPED